MKKFFVLCVVVLVGILFIAASVFESNPGMREMQYPQKIGKAGVQTPGKVKRALDFGKIPLYFIPNNGQVNGEARFYARTSRYTLWMTKAGLVFDSVHTPASGHPSQEGNNDSTHIPHSPKIERDVSRLVFLNSNPNPEMMPVDLTQHKVNYFKGNDPGKWQKGIPTSKVVLYKNVYQNIDLKVYGVESQVEYDWIVKPGANPNDICFKYDNAAKIHINKEGVLIVETKSGKMTHKRPISYQVIGGEKVAVPSTFKKTGKNMYGFGVEVYNRDYELVIDPMVAITYSTYLGGSKEDNWKGDGSGIAVDCNGYIYVSGYTRSEDFPVKNCYQCANASDEDEDKEQSDMFIAKFTPDGQDLVYSTYLGGSDLDRCYDIAIDANGYVYVPGVTHSGDFPGCGSLKGERDAVLAVLDDSGCFHCSSCFGGSELDWAYGIAVKSLNEVYIVGYTDSTDFCCTSSGYQSTYGGGDNDAFVCRIDCDTGTKICTYLGGTGKDAGYAIDLDSSGNVYITGYTGSTLSNGCAAYQTTCAGDLDAFVAKFNASLSSLLCFTYLGGTNNDTGTSIAVDSSGIYVSGHTKSSDFPTKCAIQDNYASAIDAFVTKFIPDLSGLVYSTYLGGDGEDRGWRLVVDDSGGVYLDGHTTSTNFPTQYPFQENNAGGYDVFVTKIHPNGTHLVFSTYLGGSSTDYKGDIAIGCGENPDVYVTGATYSDDFPVHNPYQCQRKGGYDAFVTRYTFSACDPVLWVDKDLINFSVKVGGTTDTQRFLIRNIGGGTLDWEVSKSSDWIQCTPTSGTNFGVVEIQLDDLDGLVEGANTTTITVTDPNAVNSPKKVYVTIWLYTTGYPPPESGLPFGAFETPGDGILVGGSVAFSGWALDDIGVESVKIYRKDGANLVHVGDACFTEWSRPDVWQAYPDYPNSFRAGWGYLLVTNCLADGTYEFHAKAKDIEENEVTLGIKTITILNATAVKPFGDIVTPQPCSMVSGSDYKIEGWAATQSTKVVNKVEVFVDGVNLGEAALTTGGTPAPPCTISGYKSFSYDLNTIGYSNDLHSVYCKATDSGDKSRDFGHRYFSIHNIGSINSISQTASSTPVYRPISEIEKIPVDSAKGFIVKDGSSKNIRPRFVLPDRGGHSYMEIEEMERIEVHLNAAPGSSKFTGYHVIGNYLMPLPVGSTLDKERGIFYWLPGPGFIGSYQMVFIEENSRGEMKKKFMNVKIVSKIHERGKVR